MKQLSQSDPAQGARTQCTPPTSAPLPHFHFPRQGLLSLLLCLLSFAWISSIHSLAATTTDVVVYRDNCLVVSSPTNIVLFTCDDLARPPQGYGISVVNRCTDVSPTVLCDPPAGSAFPPGTTQVQCALILNGQRVDRWTITVQVVVDKQPPEIRCPQDINILTCEIPGTPCGSIVNFPDPIASDDSGFVSVQCIPASGSFFPCGVTPVKCIARDRCGNTTTCEFKVVVRPQAAVQIKCPTNQVLRIPCGKECVPIQYPAPTILNGALESCDPPPGTCLKPGQHVVTCVATNACSKDVCRFIVLVLPPENNPPIIRCPNDITVEIPCDKNCTVVSYPEPLVANGRLVSCDPPPTFCFPVGETIVRCIAENDCGRTECKFVVTVKQKPAVRIRCPQSEIVIDLPCGKDCVELKLPQIPVVNGVLAECNPAPGTCLPAGRHVITCVATNDCSRDVCEFVVVVRPTSGEPPVIRCPENLIVELPCNKECAEVFYPTPVVVNGSLSFCTPAPGTCLKPGVHLVTCVATNGCAQSRCTFTITVLPTPPIDIRCPQDIIVRTCGEGEIVTYPGPELPAGTEPGRFKVVCTPPPGSFFPAGTNKVVCCVIDEKCDRRVCCEFNIIVVPGNSCVKPPLNMVLWLPFDEPAGLLAHNIVPGAPHGFHFNNPSPILGTKVLNSLGFDGSNDHVVVPNYAAIQLPVTDFSIDAWVFRRDDGGRRVIVSKVSPNAAGAPGQGYEFYLNQGVMNLALGGFGLANFNSGIVVPNNNQWHHVAVTVTRAGPGQVRFYLDGALVNTQPGPIPAPLANNSRLHVGVSSFPAALHHWQGALDEIEIFSRALTSSEIAALHHADRAGKCKIRCTIPWDVTFPTNAQCITVNALLRNDTPFPQPVTWAAQGPMPIPTPAGVSVIPAFGNVVIPVQLCRPTNNTPVGTVVRWTLTVHPAGQCPLECMGSVINPGPLTIQVPDSIVNIPGSQRSIVRISLNGLPPGNPLRLRAIGPDMEPDLRSLSLNGLPPGQPWILRRTAAPSTLANDETIEVPIQFLIHDPIGIYTILVEADINEDREWDTLASFDLSNPVVTPPLLSVTPGPKGLILTWEPSTDGILESAPTVDGPWKPVPNASSGDVIPAQAPAQYFRVITPDSRQ